MTATTMSQHPHPPAELTVGNTSSSGAGAGGETINNDAAAEHTEGLPTEGQLVLLCLDYLRDLRRAYPAEDLQQVEGINADYLSVACYALSRCFTRPDSLTHTNGNDCMFNPEKQNPPTSHHHHHHHPSSSHSALIPSLDEINRELMYLENPHHPSKQEDDHPHGDQKKEEDPGDTPSKSLDPYSWYEYDDMHPSNSHRFYPLSGLASGPSLKGPLTLGEITAAGLAGLGARARLEAEREMITSPLFEQFLQAVKSKGFFIDPDNDTPMNNPEEERNRLQRQQQNYEDRYRKVVAKFRTKLAVKAESTCPSPGTPSTPIAPGTPISLSSPMRSANLLAMSCAERQRRKREQALEQARWRKQGRVPTSSLQQPQTMITSTPTRHGANGSGGTSSLQVDTPSPRALNMTPGNIGNTNNHYFPESPVAQHDNPLDVEQAEQFKAEGNVFMQKKLYPQAVQSYTQALKLSPGGPHSHVYFSNRAAALLSMKKFPDAILDSERSLALKPDYGKAHARLGLAHFLCGNYRQSMEAYTVSLKYDPNNASSKSYLEKAAKRLADAGTSQPAATIQNSFSLVSEWDSSQRQHQQQQSTQHQQQPPPTSMDNEERIREAEKSKAKGNAYMAQRDYAAALEAYTHAIDCSPQGPQSHVYYSNRAAAFCYLERYRDAIADSEQSLALYPTYGKAHARLGLSRFFLQDYAGAVEAYTAALQHDPDNAASKSYLAKAKAKLEGRSNSRPNSRSRSRNASPAAQRGSASPARVHPPFP